MRLYQTLPKTIKWKKVLIWYFILLSFIFYSALNGTNTSTITLFGVLGLHFIICIVCLMVFNALIHGHSEGFPIIWIFSTIYEKPIIYDSLEGLEYRYWCKDNLQGKWIHCRHGFFVFQRKDDAMAFKLVYI